MPSPGRRGTPPPPRISSSSRRRSPDRRRPGPPSRGGGHLPRGGGGHLPRGGGGHLPRGGGGSARGRQSPSRSRERRRSPPTHAQPRHADNRSRPRRSRSPLPVPVRPSQPQRVRTSPIQRIRTPPLVRIRTPPPPVSMPRSFSVASGGTKRKMPAKEQRGRMPERSHENGAHRSTSHSVISPPRKINRSHSPRGRQEIPLIGPADGPVSSRDYTRAATMTYSVAMSPPGNKGRIITPPRGLSLTDRFRSDSANVFKGADGEFNITELRNTRIHVIRKIPLNQQNLEHNEIDPANLSVVRRPELLPVDRHIMEERRHYHPHHRSEGSKPIFARDEILQAMHSPSKFESTKYEPKYEPDEHERIVIVEDRPTLREGTRYASPGRYEPERYDGASTSRDTRYNGNQEDYRPSRDYERPSSSYEHRDSSRSERQGDPDLRSQLEYRRDTSRYSAERGRPHERSQDQRSGSNSDLRARLVEKRTDRHDDRTYVERPVERERRPSPVDRRRPAEFQEHVRHTRDEPESRHLRGEPEARRMHLEPEPQRSHTDPEMRRPGDFGSQRPSNEFESRRPHGEAEIRRPHGESTSRRPRGEFESRAPRNESGGRRPRTSSDSRPPRGEQESRRRRSRDESSPQRYHGDPEDEYDHPRAWEGNPEHVPRGGLYFEHDNREDEMPHLSERGRGRGTMRMRGSNFRGRSQRGAPIMRGSSSARGVRPPPFRGAPYPRGFIPTRAPRRGFPPPRSGRKSSPNWEHDMFDTLSDQPAN